MSAGLSAAAQKVPVAGDFLAVAERNIESGRLNESERPLLNFALANPRDIRALELMGRLRFRQGRLAEAKSLYRRVFELDPNFNIAKINYGLLLIKLGKAEEARRTFNEVDQAKPMDLASQLSLIRGRSLIGECRKALAAVEKLPVGTRDGEALPERAACHLELGEKQKIEAVIPLAKRARPAIAIKVAEILLGGSADAQATDLLRSVIAAAPRNVEALTLLARAAIKARDLTAAAGHLKRAAILKPRSAEVFLTRAMFENARGKTLIALEWLEKALAITPDSKAVLSQLAATAIRANKARKAVTAAEKLLALDANDPDSLYLHGAASLQAGSLDAAQRSLERLMEMRPKDSRGCLALGLTFAARRDQIEPARQQLRRCLEIDPANYEAKYQLGLSYKAQGDTASAIRFLEETIELAPDYPIALRDLGTVYLQAGEEAKARIVLTKAVALDENDADTHFQLSRLYNLTGEPDLAKKHLAIFQKLQNTEGASPR